MQCSVPLTRVTPAAYAPAVPRVAVRSLQMFGHAEGAPKETLVTMEMRKRKENDQVTGQALREPQ